VICAGIDAGSRTIKVVLLDADGLEVVGSGVVDQGPDPERRARELFEQVRRGCGRGPTSCVVATGYGRHGVGFADRTVTEITCHTRGVRHLLPQARTILDIGGQDSKLIHLDEGGAVRDFAMNDRCAAGTGCFLEVVARRLGTSLDELGRLAGRSRSPATITSTCVVFAETEIVGLLAAGASAEDIVAGVERAIARRVASMARTPLGPPLVFTGGVAMVPGMQAALESALGCRVTTSPWPQMTGALGAAILAAEAQKPCRPASRRSAPTPQASGGSHPD